MVASNSKKVIATKCRTACLRAIQRLVDTGQNYTRTFLKLKSDERDSIIRINNISKCFALLLRMLSFHFKPNSFVGQCLNFLSCFIFILLDFIMNSTFCLELNFPINFVDSNQKRFPNL